MNVLEIAANMVRNAVDTMSSKFSAFVKDEVNAKVSTLYKPGGAATLATLPALTADNAGYVYDMSEAFTTNANFREGAGHKYPAGTNVVISDVGGNVYKYDVLSGMLDGYVQESRKVGNVPLSADIPVSVTGDTAITVTNTGTASAIGYSVAHNDSGVSAGSKGDTTNQTPGFGDTFKALSATVDVKGHITNLAEHTAKIPDTEATQSAKGLMSATDKKKLDTLIDSTLSNTGKAADAKATGDAIAYLRDYLKSMDVSRTASGNPATFSDAKAANVKELSVTITPTQSGSGDPYPPGGGPNLLARETGLVWTSGTTNELTFTQTDNGVLINGVSGAGSAPSFIVLSTTLEAGTYTLTGTPGIKAADSVVVVYHAVTSATLALAHADNVTFQLSEQTEVYVRIFAYGNHGTYSNFLVAYMLVRGTAVPSSYMPYANIRPISGVSSVSVTRSGQNTVNITSAASTSTITQGVTISDGVVTINSEASGFVQLLYAHLPYPAGTPLILSGGASDVRLVAANSRWEFIATSNGEDTAFRLPDDGVVILRAYTSSAVNRTFYPMVRLASNPDPTFEPYRGQSVTVTLTDGDNPLTVYGGTLNVTTGDLTVTYVCKTLTSSSGMTYYASGNGGANYLPEGSDMMARGDWINDSATVCDTLPKSNVQVPGQAVIRFGANNSYIYFYGVNNLDGVSDAASWNAWLAERKPQIVYPLATPVTYQLTPVQLATLPGYNAISSDAGTVDVTYKADTSLVWGGG